MCVGIDWKIGPECEPERHEVPEVDVGVAAAGGVVEVGQAEVVAVLVGEHADAGVLGLHDVVRELQVGAGDGGAAGHGRRVRPDRVGALGAAAAGLVLAGVHEHDVVDDAVGLVEVAVAVDGRPGPRCRSRPTGSRAAPSASAATASIGELAGAERVVRVALHVLDGAGLADAVLVLVADASRRSRPRSAAP